MPLNPKLYRALHRAFTRVHIQKETEPMVFRVAADPMTGKKRIRVAAGRGGEDYKVCCPFCNDRRFRLEISHRWNTTDPDENVYFGVAFLRCYNDGCDANVDAPFHRRLTCHEELVEMLKAYIARGHGLVTARPSMEAELKPMTLPKKCVPLDSLPVDHAAIRYLREERSFDPYQLSQDWRLQYCIDDPNDCVAGRIIIPVYMEGILVGFQARCIGEPPSDNIPKYYTAPSTPRNRLLYNYDRAKFGKFGVLVEGPTDAWRVGTSAAVAPLGSSVSMVQIQLMKLAWGDNGVVVMLDPEYVKKPRRRPDTPSPYERLMEQLRDPTAFTNGVMEIVLADGMDPGKLTTAGLWRRIRRVAETCGFPLE